MAFFNAVRHYFSKSVTHEELQNAVVRIDPAPPKNCCEKFTAALSFPLRAAAAAYNTYYIVKARDLFATVANAIYPKALFNQLSFVKGTFHIVKDPKIMAVTHKHFRSDPHGLFQDIPNAQVFITILEELFPDSKPTADNYLMSCSREHVALLRHPIMEFVGPKALPDLKESLKDVVKDHLTYWEKGMKEGQMTVDAGEFAGCFTTAVISKLFLGHPGPFDTYTAINRAIIFINLFAMERRVRKPSEESWKKYHDSMGILREAIVLAQKNEGAFVKALQKAKMTDTSIKGTLLICFLAGSETTSLLLKYVFWQLGQHPQWQEDIISGKIDVEMFFQEAIRLFTPGYINARFAREDLLCTISDKKGVELTRYEIGKGEGILASPFFAARDPKLYPDPEKFNPQRFDKVLYPLPWQPFGIGEHACPGQWLAKKEFMELIKEVVHSYKLASSPKEVTLKGLMTLRVEESVPLTLIKREAKEQKED